MCECALAISQNLIQPLELTTAFLSDVYEYKNKYYQMTLSGLQPVGELLGRMIKNDLIRQQAEQARQRASTETRENQATDDNPGFDSSQLGANSENPPLDVEALRRKSAEIALARGKGVRGTAVTQAAGLLNGEYNQPKAEVNGRKIEFFFRLFSQKDKKEVKDREITFNDTPASLPAIHVSNIINSFSRLFFQKDKQEFHIAAANKNLHKYFPNISEDQLQALYKNMQRLKKDLRHAFVNKQYVEFDEDDFEVIADELWLETSIPVQVGDEKRSMLVQGKPDLIIRNKKTGKFTIVDFKTKYFNPTDPNKGRFKDNKYDKKTQAKYWYQLQLYKKAIEDLGGEVDDTLIMMTGVNYSRNFDEDAYNYEGMYNSRGEFKPASSRSLFNSGGVHFYDDALNARTADGDRPFDNAANRRDKRSGKKVHYMPARVEVENSSIVDDINPNGRGALMDSKTNEYVEVSLTSPTLYGEDELNSGQKLNEDLLLTSEALTSSNITIPTKPYVEPQQPVDTADMARDYLRDKGDLMQTKNVTELFRMALAYSRSRNTMTSIDGMYDVLRTLSTFNPDGKGYVNQDLITIIKRDKKFPDALIKSMKLLHFSDNNIQTLLEKVCKLPEIGVTLGNTESPTDIEQRYRKELEYLCISCTVEGKKWILYRQFEFEFTGDGLRCLFDPNKVSDGMFTVQYLRKHGLNIIVDSTQDNNSDTKVDMELSGPLRDLAEKGRDEMINEGTMNKIADYIKAQRANDPEKFKWIDSTEWENIITGLVTDIQKAHPGKRDVIIIEKVKKKLECYQ